MDFRVILTALGTVYFYEVGGGGGEGPVGFFLVGCMRKNGCRGGPFQQKKGKGGGSCEIL